MSSSLGLRGHVLAVTACLALLLLSPHSVGHARLTGSDPADGGRLDADASTVVLTFSEAIQPRFSDFALHFLGSDRDTESSAANRLPRQAADVDGARQRVALPLPEDAEDGWYLLDWEVLAEDGHTTRGTVQFEVQR